MALRTRSANSAVAVLSQACADEEAAAMADRKLWYESECRTAHARLRVLRRNPKPVRARERAAYTSLIHGSLVSACCDALEGDLALEVART